MSPLLEVSSLDAGYGDFQALFGVSISVEAGETVAMIGANGAGKSTLLKAIAGLVPATRGTISFAGHDLAGVPSNRRVALGVSLVPEGRRIFPSLSVEENLDVGAHLARGGPWTTETVYEVFPLLRPLATRSAARLSGGEQQALAIGRALRANPSLLLLDEVSLGLAPVIVHQLYGALPRISASGTTVLLVEQDVRQALRAARRVYCLLEGRISLAAASTTVSRDEVTAAYFGLERPAS